MRPALFVAFTALLLASSHVIPGAVAPLAAQNAPVLVSTEWLAERLGEEELVVLHVGNAASFASGHVPGARSLTLQAFAPEVDGMSTEMPDAAELRDVLEAAGVSSDSRIVIYGATHPPQLAARLYITLEHFGLGARASLLDGGLRAWEAEGRPVSTEAVSVARGSLPELREGSELLVDHDFVENALADPRIAVLDARDPPFWTGEQQNQQRAERAGRIPGALNIPFRTLVDDSGHLLDLDDLAARFESAGVQPGQPVITYCHVGQQASLLFVAARLLGHEVWLYDGSYEDWSQRPELPVATGG